MRKNNFVKKALKKAARTVAVLTLAFSTVAGLTGCQSDNNASEGADSNNPDAKVINIGISSTSSKNHFFEEDGTETGFEYELIKALDKELPQYKINIVTEEFASLFVSLDSGVVDAVFGNLRRSEKRDESYIHTYRAYNYSPYRILVESNNSDINSIDDLDGKNLGISQGSLQATILEQYQKDHGITINYVYTKDYTNDLVAGRIDAFIAPEFDLEKYNQSFEDIKFKIVGEEVSGESGAISDANTYVYLAEGSETLRDDLSAAIYKLRESGELEKLNTKFYGESFTARINTEKEDEYIKEIGK